MSPLFVLGPQNSGTGTDISLPTCTAKTMAAQLPPRPTTWGTHQTMYCMRYRTTSRGMKPPATSSSFWRKNNELKCASFSSCS